MLLQTLISWILFVGCANSITILKPTSCDLSSDEKPFEIQASISPITESLIKDGSVVRVLINDGGGTIYNFDVPPTPYANTERWFFSLENTPKTISIESGSIEKETVLNIVVPALKSGYYTIWLEIVHPKSSQYATSDIRSEQISFRISTPNSTPTASMYSLQKSILEKQRQLDEQDEEKKVRRDTLAPLYRPLMLHPELLILDEGEVFDPQFLEFLNSHPQSKDELMKFLTLEADSGVYSFPLLRKEFCDKLLEEIDHIHESKIDTVAPNTMNNYGVILDDFGFESFLNQLMEQYLKPFTSILFPEWGGNSLDGHHGFVVQYKLGEDVKLDNHMDSCEITLNVCLGREFRGGELVFRGVRDTDSEFAENFRIGHSPGRALLHVGQHVHGALPITEGARSNLILWMMSSEFRQSPSEKFYHKCSQPHQYITNSDIM